jgi:hypothetical protein
LSQAGEKPETHRPASDPLPRPRPGGDNAPADQQNAATVPAHSGQNTSAAAGSAIDTRVQIGVAYGTEKRTWLEWAVQEFAASRDGQLVHVNLIPMGSLESAQAIVDGDDRIHVWAPASELYLKIFLQDWEAEYRSNPIIESENLALTPMVIVMWEDRYQAFLTKASEVSLKMISFAMRARTGWGAIAGKPEWGHFKFAHTNPSQSNSGLLTLILLAYAFHQKTSGLTVGDVMSEEFQDYLYRFERGVSGLSNSTGNMMREMIYKGPASFDAVMVYESLAIDFFQKAEGRWDRLRIVYPECNLWNDNPYYVLNAPWTTPAHQKGARAFLQFLMSEPIQTRALDHGFRPGNPSVPIKGARNPFKRYQDFGLSIDLPEVCEVPSPEVIESLQETRARCSVPR